MCDGKKIKDIAQEKLKIPFYLHSHKLVQQAIDEYSPVLDGQKEGSFVVTPINKLMTKELINQLNENGVGLSLNNGM